MEILKEKKWIKASPQETFQIYDSFYQGFVNLDQEKFLANFKESFLLTEIIKIKNKKAGFEDKQEEYLNKLSLTYKIILDFFYHLLNHAILNSFPTKQQICLLNVGCFYLNRINTTDRVPRLMINDLSDCLLRYSVDDPPSHHQYFTLEEMKGIFRLFAYSILKNHSEYVGALRTLKTASISLFQLFSRQLPMNLPLNYSKKIADPLSIPFLRKYLLPKNSIYFSEAEILAFNEDPSKLDSLSPEERAYIAERSLKVLRKEAIKKVVDGKIEELRQEAKEGIKQAVESSIKESKF